MQYEDAISLPRKPDLPDGTPAAPSFDYAEAFSRNIGWVTESEQQRLRNKRVAIAGMGGVGSAHLLVLARLGIGAFAIADFDRFEIANFNRQTGATLSSLGRPKVEVMAAMARDINPELRLATFPRGLDATNMDSFLEGADLFVDGLDFFAMDIRRAVFARCAERRIPAITAAPIGFGTAYIVFLPGRMTFEELFRMDGLPEHRQYVNFATALTPRGLHRPCLADPSRIDLPGKRGPSTAAAISLCAGVVGAEAAKILLGRGSVRAAPWVHQFDAFRSRWRRSWLPFGNAGPLQSLKRAIGYRVFAAMSRNARPQETPQGGPEVARILDMARWAPSGDNAQPWRFEIVDDSTVRLRILVEGEARNIYDFNGGQPTLLSAGFLLETARIAATRYGRRLDWHHAGSDHRGHRIKITMPKDSRISESPLFPFIPIRSVDRTPYRLMPLQSTEKAALEAALGAGFELRWHETAGARWRMARLNAQATDIRLRLREAHEVHRRILDWSGPFSMDGVPAAAVGLDPLTVRLMRWAMRDWRRHAFMNRYLAGTLIPRIQLDLIPGLCCAAHFVIARRASAAATAEPVALLEAGAALQRFWLTATRMGLALQPGLAPLCFAHYARTGERATGEARRLRALSARLATLAPGDPADIVFAGRLGYPGLRGPAGRSLRWPLDRLLGD